MSPRPAYPPPPRAEHHWPPLLILTIAIGLEFLLPERLSAGPSWLLPACEGVLLLRLISASSFKISGRNRRRRRISLVLVAAVSATNGISLVMLCHLLLHHNVTAGSQLIAAGMLIWLTNVLLFSVWYWELDRGGPGLRAAGEDGVPDFFFPQMDSDALAPGWRPQFLDYLYVSLTNAAAFSPTDTMPLTVGAKMIMGLQSLISLVTLGLVISRAVNIL